jgi:hypothetical protein
MAVVLEYSMGVIGQVRKQVGVRAMQARDLDAKINSFLQRKEEKYPNLVMSGREEMRTVKYAQSLRSSGQLLFSR